MMTTLALSLFEGLVLQCAPDCPTAQAHIESVPHTQGKACPACAARIDVCFQRCAGCAAKAGVCQGCGGRPVEAKTWKPAEGEPGIRLIRSKDAGGPDIDYSTWSVVVIVQGVVLDSEKARLAAVREFDDRIVVTYATRAALCGSEPRAFDALCVQVPRSSKPLVVRHARTSVPRGLTVSAAAEFPPR